MNTNAQRAQIKRINRKLTKRDSFHKLYTSRGYGQLSNLGEYHIVDTYNNSVIDYQVDLDSLERELSESPSLQIAV
jgi:hypothetical protein